MVTWHSESREIGAPLFLKGWCGIRSETIFPLMQHISNMKTRDAGNFTPRQTMFSAWSHKLRSLSQRVRVADTLHARCIFPKRTSGNPAQTHWRCGHAYENELPWFSFSRLQDSAHFQFPQRWILVATGCIFRNSPWNQLRDAGLDCRCGWYSTEQQVFYWLF